MSVINITKARQNLYRLVQDVNEESNPITIVNNKGKNAVLIGEEDWSAIQETLYLNSIPEMAESIREGMKEPIEDCVVYEENEEW